MATIGEMLEEYQHLETAVIQAARNMVDVIENKPWDSQKREIAQARLSVSVRHFDQFTKREA